METAKETIGYGVCRLSVVPVRSQPSDLSDQVTQLLFGDHYLVTGRSRDKKWITIRIQFDGYEGWIDARQHHPIAKEYFEFIDKSEAKITTDLVSDMLYNKVHVPVLIGSIIPHTGSDLFRSEEQFAFNGGSKSLGQQRDVPYIIETATKYLHAPYQWGGKSPFGIDCSGFIQMIFRIAGYSLPRDAGDQSACGKDVTDPGHAEPGDLAFFRSSEGKITHVGLLLEGSRIIHASGRVRIDWFDEEGILNSETKIYTHSLAAIRKVREGS